MNPNPRRWFRVYIMLFQALSASPHKIILLKNTKVVIFYRNSFMHPLRREALFASLSPLFFSPPAIFYGSLTPRWRGDDGFQRKSHHERRWRTQSGWLALAASGNTSPIGRGICTHKRVKPVGFVSCLLSSPKDEEFRRASAAPFNGPRGETPVIREIADSDCCLARLKIKCDVRRRGFRQTME
ncbi:hypothetical protein J2T08_002365 [Neorhizobium galegae]|nr:hypothetical protein [Neorhizobium galegae]